MFKKIVSLLLIVLLSQSGRATNAGAAFSIGDEREVGEKLLYAVRSSFPLLGDPDLHQYINSLGQEVLEVAGIQFFDYRFYVVESNQFNAFAAPSGFIFFYSELIESMNSEDELVSVIAHEIGHVVKRHLASRLQKGTVVNIAALGLALAAIALGGGGAATQALLTGSMAAGQSAQLYFSRQDETEADLLAYKWMKDLHRDPEGQKRMLQTMRRITRYRMGQVPQYLLTHPDPEARLDQVEALISADGEKEQGLSEQRDFAFLRFKYRILSLTSKNRSAREYLAGKMSDPKSSAFDINMARYGMAQIDRRENNFSQALAEIEKVIKAFPDQNILQVDKGIILAEMGENDEARKILEGAAKANPSDMYAEYNLAKILMKTGDRDRAKQLLLDVSYRMPEYSEVYFEIGKLLAEQGHSIESRFYLGKFNLYEGKLKLAEENFKQVKASKDADMKIKEESEATLELIERLKKG